LAGGREFSRLGCILRLEVFLDLSDAVPTTAPPRCRGPGPRPITSFSYKLRRVVLMNIPEYPSRDNVEIFLGFINISIFPDLWNRSTDAEAATQKLQGDLKSGIDTIMHTGSGILEKARTEFRSHSKVTRSKELGKSHSFRVTSKEER
jgi:hypothetical protein